MQEKQFVSFWFFEFFNRKKSSTFSKIKQYMPGRQIEII